MNTRSVYLLGSPWNTLVKIGCSRTPDVRFGTIATATPFPVKLLWVAPKGVDCESYLHRECKPFHVHGEWFDFKDIDPVEHVKALIVNEDRKRIERPALPEVPHRNDLRAAADFIVMTGIDTALRGGVAVKVIASKLDPPTVPALTRRLIRNGFKIAKDGTPRLVDTFYGRDFPDWVASGELICHKLALKHGFVKPAAEGLA